MRGKEPTEDKALSKNRSRSELGANWRARTTGNIETVNKRSAYPSSYPCPMKSSSLWQGPSHYLFGRRVSYNSKKLLSRVKRTRAEVRAFKVRKPQAELYSGRWGHQAVYHTRPVPSRPLYLLVEPFSMFAIYTAFWIAEIWSITQLVAHSVSCRKQLNLPKQQQTTNRKHAISRNPRPSQILLSEVNAVQSIVTMQQRPRTRTMSPYVTNDNNEHHEASVERSAAGNTNGREPISDTRHRRRSRSPSSYRLSRYRQRSLGRNNPKTTTEASFNLNP